MKVNIGGQRLGSGNKMEVQMRNYERSNHNLNKVFRSTMSAGTLVPCYVNIGLPGDSWDIDLESLVRTMPTNGPVFGSFKMQIDFFQVPVRLFQAQLHMNLLGVGLNMSQVKLPIMEVCAKIPFRDKKKRGAFDQSSLMAYLGLRGGQEVINTVAPEISTMKLYRNALPLLSYWSIYKQYYANKQEKYGRYIKNSILASNNIIAVDNTQVDEMPITFTNWTQFDIEFSQEVRDLDWYLEIGWEHSEDIVGQIDIKQIGMCEIISEKVIRVKNVNPNDDYFNFTLYGIVKRESTYTNKGIQIGEFELNNIDDVHEDILRAARGTVWKVPNNKLPYSDCIGQFEGLDGDKLIEIPFNNSSQNGLALKTYQSDIFNNWLNTEWIDGDGGINEITAIDTSEGMIKIDTIIFARKVYDMLNRIAVSGGSYQDWQSAVYGEETIRMAESPIYVGGMSREVVFDEVVSTADANSENAGDQPLGSLAGKGTQSQTKKGGNINIKVNETSLIMGIVSLTPRIDYSQGNKWHTLLETMDDFHKPPMDGIGWQELITENMCHFDSAINTTNKVSEFKSAGKQPSWVNYMTDYNEVYGHFADPDNLGFMVLTRNYEYQEGLNRGKIGDLTTYVDPAKFNYAFANAAIDAQNFWVQIAMDIQCRRKMSAKIMPNL